MTFRKIIRVTLVCVCFIFVQGLKHIKAQDMLGSLDSADHKPQLVSATFKSTHLVNFQTVETVGRRTLDFRISHRFGFLSDGAQNLFGLDGPATIKLAFDYSYDGRLMFGIGRTSTDKLYESFVKYKLLRQAENGMPVTLTLLAGMNITTQTDPQKDITGVDRYKYFSDRLSFQYQIMVARKFSDHFSLQLSPILIHYNIVTQTTDKNDIIALLAMGRYKFNRRTAVTAEYGWRISNYSLDQNKYYNVASLGIDLETGGHVFQMFLTNAFGISEVQTIPYTTGNVMKGELRLGFNISRVFRL